MDWSWLNATTDETSTFGPASEREVIEAEVQIGKFPPEYRDFVLSCGSARILGDEIFGVHAEVPKHIDVVELTLFERASPYRPLPVDLIAVNNDGAGNLFCVKVSQGGVQPDNRVVALWRDDESAPELIADSFYLWLRSLWESDGECSVTNGDS